MRPRFGSPMKKIEALIGRPGVEILLAKMGSDGRPVLAEISIVESRSRFCKLPSCKDHQPEWQPCVRLDLIVSDRETQSAVDMIRKHSHLPRCCDSNIIVFPIETTLEISARQS